MSKFNTAVETGPRKSKARIVPRKIIKGKSRVVRGIVFRSIDLIDSGGSGAGDPEDLLVTEELAHWLRVTPQWLHAGRFRDYGPPYVKARGIVRYRRQDVIDWIKSLVVHPVS